MAIQLIDIANAKSSYVTNKINAKLSAPTPSGGQTINIGEHFTFSLTVSNAPESSGGVHLIGVTYHFIVGHFGTPIFALIVPPYAKGVATDTRVGGNTYMPGQVVDDYYLHYKYSISAGESLIIDDLEGVAQKQGSGAVNCTIQFTFQPLSDLDSTARSTKFDVV
jgi:hypothetical protein